MDRGKYTGKTVFVAYNAKEIESSRLVVKPVESFRRFADAKKFCDSRPDTILAAVEIALIGRDDLYVTDIAMLRGATDGRGVPVDFSGGTLQGY